MGGGWLFNYVVLWYMIFSGRYVASLFRVDASTIFPKYSENTLTAAFGRFSLQLLVPGLYLQLPTSDFSCQFSTVFRDEVTGFQSMVKMLRPTVNRPVCLGVKPQMGPKTRFLLLSDSCGFVHVGCPLWREDGCRLQYLLAPCSAVRYTAVKISSIYHLYLPKRTQLPTVTPLFRV
jgi:hypothetical protein